MLAEAVADREELFRIRVGHAERCCPGILTLALFCGGGLRYRGRRAWPLQMLNMTRRSFMEDGDLAARTKGRSCRLIVGEQFVNVTRIMSPYHLASLATLWLQSHCFQGEIEDWGSVRAIATERPGCFSAARRLFAGETTSADR